ncbi:MAG: hypothetical protein NNA25_10645 [Nitrospira sp.]|nr:hypothetical protein [Nitrospira sp.]
MRVAKARLVPQSAFGTLPRGDTFFGQLCWAVRNRYGEARLVTLLEGYTKGAPFVVVSDAMPAGYLPRPALPAHWFLPIEGADRKQAKTRQWLPVASFHEPVSQWLRHCVSAAELPGGWADLHLQPHNSINRRTGTTGEGAFAPYTMEQYWFGRPGDGNQARPSLLAGPLDLYCVLDEARPEALTMEELRLVITDIGMMGFGRDASIGLGRFSIESFEEHPSLPSQDHPTTYLTLAPCAPQGETWRADRCFYHLFTRFGRHGDIGVHAGHPFKTPLLLTTAGSVFTPPTFEPRPFIGHGLGGDGSLSKSLPATVHQGYAPVVAIRLDHAADPVHT